MYFFGGVSLEFLWPQCLKQTGVGRSVLALFVTSATYH